MAALLFCGENIVQTGEHMHNAVCLAIGAEAIGTISTCEWSP